jgi:hypothetical protein
MLLLLLLLLLQVPKPLDPQELDQLKQQIASELHAQLAASSGGKELTPEQLAQVGSSSHPPHVAAVLVYFAGKLTCLQLRRFLFMGHCGQTLSRI